MTTSLVRETGLYAKDGGVAAWAMLLFFPVWPMCRAV